MRYKAAYVFMAVSILVAILLLNFTILNTKFILGTNNKKKHNATIRTVSVFISASMFNRSHMQKISMQKYVVKKGNTSNEVLLSPVLDERYAKDKILYVSIVSKQGKQNEVKWHVDHDLVGHHGVGMLVLDGVHLKPGMGVEVGKLRDINFRNGYFVSARPEIRSNWGVHNFSGCLKIANNVTYRIDHGGDMVVHSMNHPGEGFHGWCYRYDNNIINHKVDKNKRQYHFFAASTAPSWHVVAKWFNHEYTKVSNDPSNKISAVYKSIESNVKNPSDQNKIHRIEKWMRNNLKYSGLDTLPYVPKSFDNVFNNGYGDCKALSMVMIDLLNKAGIKAHFAVLSADDPHMFNRNSANLSLLNHVIVYIPSQHEFYDPSVGTGRQLHGYEVMDVSNGRILTVPFPK